MRIGIDVRALIDGKRTGVETYIVNLLEHLLVLDKDNQYLLFANHFPRVSSMPQFAAANAEYCFFRYPNKLFSLSQVIFRKPALSRLVGNLDLFFSPHWRALTIDEQVPLVVTFHDLSFEAFPEFFTLRRQLWHRFMGYRRVTSRADRIIAVSHSTKDDLVEYYKVPAEKIEVIYSGVTLSDQEATVDLPDQYFLFFGTFEPRKNLNSILAAYETYLQQSRVKRSLVLAGSHGWKANLQLPNRLKPFIQILYNPSEEEKATIFRRAYALLFVSWYEGFGFPILEGAKAGRPVITSMSTSMAEIGGDFSLLVNPLRPAQIAASMLALENDPDLYHTLQTRSRAAAEQYTWQACARQTLDLFNQLRKN